MTNKNKEEDSYLYEYFMLASTLLGILFILGSRQLKESVI